MEANFKQQKGFFRPFSGGASLVNRIPRLFMLVGLVLVSIGFYNLYRAYQTYSWPSVQGLIIASGVERHTRTYTDSTTNRIKEEFVYDAHVAYQYVVDGQRYSNDDIRIGGTISSNFKTWARRILNKYPEGKAVPVFYSPKDPSQSVLENGIHLSTLALSFLGLAFTLFAIAIKTALRNLFQKLFGLSSPLEERSAVEPLQFSGVSDSRLLGKWKVVHQTPSYEDLAAYSLKLFSSGSEQISTENIVTPKGTTTVTITETEIRFVQPGANLYGKSGQKYTLQGGRMALVPIKLGMLTKAMEPLLPSYYDFTFDGSELILTSDKIEGCDNQRIVYHLTKA